MKMKSYLMLDDEFIQYCKLNNIEDVEKFAKQVFDKGFTIIKHGEKPKISLPLTEGRLKTNVKKQNELVPSTEPPPPIPKKDLYDE